MSFKNNISNVLTEKKRLLSVLLLHKNQKVLSIK
jgi:hypothetical protein